MKSDRELYQRIESSPYFKPGDLARSFERLVLDDGRTSYQYLIEPLCKDSLGRLLDLAGGSGPLSKACIETLGDGWDVTLLDASTSELAQAHALLAATTCKIVEGCAQSIPFSNSSFDAVVCHLCIMLFNPLRPALNEIVRVLKPSGILIFNLIGEFEADVERSCAELFSAREKYVPDFQSWGDPSCRFVKQFASELSTAYPLTLRQLDPYTVRAQGSPSALWKIICPFFQIQYLLDAASREELFRLFIARIEQHLELTGRTHFALPLLRLVFQKDCDGSKLQPPTDVVRIPQLAHPRLYKRGG
jgi:ubiquinone/menaquinone biosynthesis C-methylase UbiE